MLINLHKLKCNSVLPGQLTNRFTRAARRSAMLLRLLEVKSSSMASFGSVTMPFSSCIRWVLSLLGIRAPTILILLLTLNCFAAFSSLKVSIMFPLVPLPCSALPSENITRILTFVEI